jgi:hypothetical protein
MSIAAALAMLAYQGGKLADPPRRAPAPVDLPPAMPADQHPRATPLVDSDAIGRAIGDVVATQLNDVRTDMATLKTELKGQNQAMLDQMSLAFAQLAKDRAQLKGPCDGTNCPYATALEASRSRMATMVDPKQMTMATLPTLYFDQDDSGQWRYNLSQDELDRDIAKANLRLQRSTRQVSTVAPASYTTAAYAPIAPVTYAAAPASYAAPMSYAASYAPASYSGLSYGMSAGGSCSTGSCGR